MSWSKFVNNKRQYYANNMVEIANKFYTLKFSLETEVPYYEYSNYAIFNTFVRIEYENNIC